MLLKSANFKAIPLGSELSIQLDHLIVPARDRIASARLLSTILGVPWAETGFGPFSPVYVDDGCVASPTSGQKGLAKMRDFVRLLRLSRRNKGDGKARNQNTVYVGAEARDFAGSGAAWREGERKRRPTIRRPNVSSETDSCATTVVASIYTPRGHNHAWPLHPYRC